MENYFRKMDVVWRNVTDWEAAKKFYGETLALPVAFMSEEAGWCEFGSEETTKLAISRSETRHDPTRGNGTPVFLVDDVRAAIANLQERGVKCDQVQEIPGLTILGTFYDPDGNPIQFAQTLG